MCFIQDKLNDDTEKFIESKAVARNVLIKNMVMISYMIIPDKTSYIFIINSPAGKWTSRIFRVKNDWRKHVEGIMKENNVEFKSVDFIDYK